jgi:hypothetical protein
MSESAVTLHARQRVAQRGFRQGDLDLVMLLGHRTPDGYVLRDQDVQELIADLPRLRPRARASRADPSHADKIRYSLA